MSKSKLFFIISAFIVTALLGGFSSLYNVDSARAKERARLEHVMNSTEYKLDMERQLEHAGVLR